MPSKDDPSNNGDGLCPDAAHPRMHIVPRDILRDAFSAFRDEVVRHPQDVKPAFLLEAAAELIDIANTQLTSCETPVSADKMASLQAMLDDMIQHADASPPKDATPRV